jgi:hypothetical protein
MRTSQTTRVAHEDVCFARQVRKHVENLVYEEQLNTNVTSAHRMREDKISGRRLLRVILRKAEYSRLAKKVYKLAAGI